MSKIRIFQIAKELNISHTDILNFLKSKSVNVSSHMSPVDDTVRQIILEEFAKDKLQVDRFRKEQIRREIHDVRLKERQKSGKKLELLSLNKQREIEKKENINKEISSKTNTLDKSTIIDSNQSGETKNVEKLSLGKMSKSKQFSGSKKTKKISTKSSKKMRTINLSNIQSEIGSGVAKPTQIPKKEINELGQKSVKTKVKGILAKIDSKNKKKIHKKSKIKNDVDSDNTTLPVAKIAEFSNVEELAKIFNITSSEIIQTCIDLGMLVTKNQRIDWDVIELLAENFGFSPEKRIDLGEEIFKQEDSEDDVKKAVPRPPVITVMGHVDHGKTSLLDYIRKTNVTSGESGGITQHIGAYKVNYKERDITFLDTPGHEAFTAMRARGAQVTDLVVLVVAADDSVMPQTIEAINHTRAAEVPMIVAINKIDKPGADPEKVRRELSENNVLTEKWGGKVQDVEISALNGDGIDELMESLLLETDVLELKSNKECNASGVIIDSRLDKGLGPIGTVLVQKGTLRIGDPFISGDFYGKVKSISDESGDRKKKAEPSDAIQVQGFDKVPQAADLFAVVDDEKEIKRIASERQRVRREIEQKKMMFSLDNMSSLIKEGSLKTLALVIKGDVDGSVEALSESLEKIKTDEVGIKVIHKGVGMVTESDVLLAEASKAIIIGFHVQVSSNARLQANQAGVDIRTYNIIYQAVEELTLSLEGLLEPERIEKEIGKAEVLTQFKIPKLGFIAGCKVINGKIIRNGKARLVRDGKLFREGLINSLKRHKDDAKEVKEGLECGIGIVGVKKFREGDIIDVYEIEKKKRKLVLN